MSNDQFVHAAEAIFQQALNLPNGAEIVILADETTIEPVTILAEAAIQSGFHPIPLYFTTQMQRVLGSGEVMPILAAILDDVAATLICLTGAADCLPFRDTIRRAAWNAGCKVAHMPGIDAPTLLLADVDYQQVNHDCELLALALVKGRYLAIHSKDRRGNEYRLDTRLDPWKRFPIISDGIIQNASWGNVPSGETYIAPPEGAAEGEIVIDGSMPGHLLASDEELVLSFRNGQLVSFSPQGSSAANYLQAKYIDYAQKSGDRNWSYLAEIGFGVNPRVQRLTGNALLDEKCFGSVHIALGDSEDMGGNIRSAIHCDMVCCQPTVTIDDKLIVRQGQLRMVPEEWREDHRYIPVDAPWSGDREVGITAKDTEIDGDQRLRRVWHTSSGRVCSVPVGNDPTAQQAARLYSLLRNSGTQWVSFRNIASRRGFNQSLVQQLLTLLVQYGLVDFRDTEGM